MDVVLGLMLLFGGFVLGAVSGSFLQRLMDESQDG
jgi:hypothetical protein